MFPADFAVAQYWLIGFVGEEDGFVGTNLKDESKAA